MGIWAPVVVGAFPSRSASLLDCPATIKLRDGYGNAAFLIAPAQVPDTLAAGSDSRAEGRVPSPKASRLVECVRPARAAGMFGHRAASWATGPRPRSGVLGP